MALFVPLHLSALKRAPHLEGWIKSWAEIMEEDGLVMETLEPSDWFYRGHDLDDGTTNCYGFWQSKLRKGLLLWCPPPATADIALEGIRKASLKQTSSIHVFVCPRLMEPVWRSHLHKYTDFLIEIPAGNFYWPSDMFEPLVLAIYFPYISHRPWELQGSPSLVELGKHLRDLWKESGKSSGNILHQLWCKASRFQAMPLKLVFKMLRSFGQLGIPC